MSNVPVQLLVAAFPDEKAAQEGLKNLKRIQQEKQIQIDSVAVLGKDENGRLRIKETADLGGGKGAAIGGVTGAAIGLIAGPALLVPAVVGALIGGLAAKLRDSGFPDERLKIFGEELTPGSSAILAVVEHKWMGEIEKSMADTGATLLTETLSTDVAGQLKAGHKVAYSAIRSDQGFSAGGVTGKGAIEANQMITPNSGEYGSRFFATNEGFVVHPIEEREAEDTTAGKT